MNQYAERIKIIREKAGLTQTEFGEMMGITTNTQNNYEKGLRYPTLKYLLQLEEAGFDTFFILTGTHNTNKISPLENELLELWRTASKEIRFAALNVLATGKSSQVANYIGNITGSVITGGIQQNAQTSNKETL